MEAEKKVIILNKIFEGSWNQEDGNISHEIIDFIQSDNGNCYAYNEPVGHCPEYIYVDGQPGNKETHKAEYLLLTGSGRHSFNILYCIKLKRKLHTYSQSRNPDTLSKTRGEIIDNIIKKEKIEYGGYPLDKIYGGKDDSLLVTFEIDTILQAKKSIIGQIDYNFQRNKGYIRSDDNHDDYQAIIRLIEEKNNWESFVPQKIENKGSQGMPTKKNISGLITQNPK